MARFIHTLSENVWVSLPFGILTLTVHEYGPSGHLQLNTAQDDATSLIVSRGNAGHQFRQDTATDRLYAKATGPGWVVASDQ